MRLDKVRWRIPKPRALVCTLTNPLLWRWMKQILPQRMVLRRRRQRWIWRFITFHCNTTDIQHRFVWRRPNANKKIMAGYLGRFPSRNVCKVNIKICAHIQLSPFQDVDTLTVNLYATNYRFYTFVNDIWWSLEKINNQKFFLWFVSVRLSKVVWYPVLSLEQISVKLSMSLQM